MAAVRITIVVDGHEFPLTDDGIDAAERAAHAASGLPEPSQAAVQATDGVDRAQLLSALEEAHRVHHEAVAVNKQLNELLRERTIERDHWQQDSHLWALVVAHYVVYHGEGGALELDGREVNACEGMMLDADNDVDTGVLTIRLADRPQASEEGGGG